MTIDQLSEKRKKLRQQLIENEAMDGFKELLTVLYSDKVHFIYELLQNAEDVGASKVQFILRADRLEFEHNGDKLFEIEDVESITNIGSSTKVDDDTSIGKFGIGFKSVFAYTATPEIESGDFHFRIHDMFVPDTEGLAPGSLGEKRTHFIFPFDNPEKTSKEAGHEIETKLRQLNEDALLFLNNICKIEYCLPDSTSGFLERKQGVDENRIEISVKHPGYSKPESTHYFRSTKDVNVQDDGKRKECRIAVAFGMDKSEDESWKIKPLNPGQVSIYFPAVKETSNLRFHLHAPFASTVARDSVRECPANEELRNHLAELIAESMHTIRDQGFLNVEFLAALPNNRDNLRPFYLPVQERLIKEFNTEKLTPMRRKRSEHAAASGCYRTPPRYRALSDLINDEDLATLLEKDRDQPLWIANPPQINQPEDNFLSMLDIALWGPEKLIKIIDTQSDRTMEFLRQKPVEWHQDLYEFLGSFLISAPSSPLYIARERKDKLSNLRIILCSDGEYRTGSECYFRDDMEFEFEEEKTQLEEFYYVAKGVYLSGQNKNRQQKVREFLEKIGVCEIDESERVKAILRQRYEDPDTIIPPELHEEDMNKFIALVEKEPDQAVLFKNYHIFNTTGGEGCTVGLVFLDSPYLETGLSTYYEDNKCDIDFLEECKCVYFSLAYEESDIDSKELGKFAAAVGAKTKLEVTKQVIPRDHPQFDYLRSASGYRWTHTSIDEDYSIPEFPILLANPSIIKSRLVWQAMDSAPDNSLKSQFRWNQSYPTHETDSTLVHELRNAKWIPQENGDSISFVRPCHAVKENLPGGFPYDTGQKWLEAIEFGKAAKEQTAENTRKNIEESLRNQRAKELGFESGDAAEKAAEFFKEQGKSPDELLKKLRIQKRRKELLIIDLSDAEEKEYEIRARSIRSSRSTIDPRTTLRALYTTDENRMHCQMCSKEMPFKQRNSDEDYFEAVEALGKAYFFKEHEAQYLAFCPGCAAEYKEYVKKDPNARETFHDALKNSDSPQIHVESNGRSIYIRFEDKHWQDLKTVLYYYENIYKPDESD